MSRRRPARRATPNAARAETARLASLREVVDEIAGSYLLLFEATSAQSLENRSGNIHGTQAFAPVPVNLEVLHAIDCVEADVRWLEDRLRLKVFHLPQVRRPDPRRDRAGVNGKTHLGYDPRLGYEPGPVHDPRHGAGHTPDLRILAALRWVADALPAAMVAGHAETCEDALWRTQGYVRAALGLPEPVRTLRTCCPRCSAPSLLRRQDLVVCGNPDCRTAAGLPNVWRTGEEIA